MAENDIIAGLDLGTTKVCTIVAEQTEEGLDIIGIGSVPSKGLKKGVVVTREDVERVLDQAKAVPLPGDRQVLHVLPQEYIVDDQDGIKEPVGMSGVRLEARVHMVTAANTAVTNLKKCAERCGLHVSDVVLQPLASAEAVLSDDEKEIGVALVDIGGGTTDVIIYVDGAVVHTSVIPIGGINLTNDVATGLRTPMAEAERIKIKYGCSATHMVDEDETIEVPSVGGRRPRVLPRRVLCDIIEPRVEEIFQACRHVIVETGYADMLASGVVITGGTTLLDGMPEHAESIFRLPVRRGTPSGVGGLIDVVRSPSFATGVGLVKYGALHLQQWDPRIMEPEQTEIRSRVGLGTRLGAWFREVF